MAELGRGAVPALLRQCRFDAALRDAGGCVPGTDGDWARCYGTGRTWRRRSRGSSDTATATTTASSSTADADGGRTRQPGLEGQPRLGIPCGRHARATDRSRSRKSRLTLWRMDAGAAIDRRLGHVDARSASRCVRSAAAAFDQHFFDESLGTYVLALDGEKRPAGSVRRTPGTRCSPVSRIPSVRQRRRHAHGDPLVLRLGHTHRCLLRARYNPMSYHNGSVWPHDNALIAAGSRATVSSIKPRGSSRDSSRRRLHRSAPPAGTVLRLRATADTWSDAISGGVHAAGVGRRRAALHIAVVPRARLRPDARRISFNEPFLPEFLDEVTLSRLTVGNGSVDVVLRRSRAQVVVDVIERKGDVRVITTA